MTNYFDRFTKLIIKSPYTKTEATMTSDDLTINFVTKRWTSGEESESYGAIIDNTILADIGIFNLSDETIANIDYEDAYTGTGGSTVTLMSGYRDNFGVVFTGTVASLEKTQNPKTSDVLTILRCRESKALVQNAVVNITYEGGKTLSELVTSLANKAQIPIGRIDPKNIVAKARTFPPTKPLNTIFTELAIEGGFTYEFKQGAIYFLDTVNRSQTIYDLTPESGLLSARLTRNPAYTNDSYNVMTVMLPDMLWLGGVKIGDYICSVTTKPIHTSNASMHTTEFLATIGQNVGEFVFGGGKSGGYGFGGSW